MLHYQSLRKIRREKKITSAALAKLLNKTRETVSAWERGLHQPCEGDIRLIAQILNVPVGDISDLVEIKIEGNNIDQSIDLLDIGNLAPDMAMRFKKMRGTCLDLSATVTRLRSNLFKYDILFQSLPFIIYTKNNKLEYTYANEKFLNLVGHSYNKNSISGASSCDIFGMKEYSQILELEQKVLKTRQRLSNQHVYIPGTFKKKIGLLTIIPILNDKKEVEELVSSIEDITDTYAEEKMRKDLESIVNKINHMLWIGEETVVGDEKTFKYTFISNNVLDIFGVEKREILHNSNLWLELITDDDIESVREFTKIKDFPKKNEYKINHPYKGIRWICTEVFKEGENKFFGITTDITKEKERDHEKEATLLTLDVATDAIKIAKIKDDNKEYIFVNKANKNLYELPLSKIKQHPGLWIEYVHPDDKEKLVAIDKRKEEGHLHINYRLLLSDGKTKYIEENIFRKIIEGVLYSGTIKRDVTNGHKERLITQSILKALNVSRDAIWITISGTNIYMNQARADLYEMDLKDIMKNPDFWQEFLHHEDYERVLGEANSRRCNGKIVFQKYRLIMPDSRIKYIFESKFDRIVDDVKYSGGLQAEVSKKLYDSHN